MPFNREKFNVAETQPLTEEHPAYIKLAEKIRELEAAGIAPESNQYIAAVEEFVQAEPDLATELAKQNPYLAKTIARMNEAVESPGTTPESTDSLPAVEALHRRAFVVAQEMKQDCQRLASELLERANNRLTPLIAEDDLRTLYHSVQPLEDALVSGQTEQVAAAVQRVVNSFSAIEKRDSQQISEDTESLKKLGFYFREMGQRSGRLARIYGELDTQEALEISHEALRLEAVIQDKHDMIARMYDVLSNR